MRDGGELARTSGRGPGRRRQPAARRRGAPTRRSEPGARGRRAPAWSLTAALRRSRSSRRLTWLLAAYLAVAALIGGRLVMVQVVAAEEYRELGERQTQREVTQPADRGRLYDRSGTPLALTEPAAAVYADPKAVEQAEADPGDVAVALAGHLDREPAALRERLERDAGFVYLARQLPHETGEAVRAERLPGVGVLEEPTRRYPGGSLASAVLGYVGVDHAGLSGLELQHDEALSGEPGTLLIERAPGGVAIGAAPREGRPAVPGDDLVLTLDRRVQVAAEQALEDARASYDAAAASAVVLDARTGEVLGMATAPGFDPARIGAVPPEQRRNRPVTDAFEPGSVAKVVPVAAAVDAGLAEPDEELHLPPEITVGGKAFDDPTREETATATLAEVVARSSNVGTIKVARRLGAERLHGAYERFGFGGPTGIDFPGDSSGSLPPLESWWATSLPTIALGQGVSASLLHLAVMMQTVAGGGERIEPTLVRGEVGPSGELRPAPSPDRRRVVSREAASAVTAMLTGVVERGTGRLAGIEGYDVAGKTGTAQKPHPDRRGYQEGAHFATFAGFAPADDPEVVVAVVLDEPDPIWAGETAAPVFAEITAEALRARRVPPRSQRTGPAGQPAAGSGEPVADPAADGSPAAREEADWGDGEAGP